MAEVVVPGSDDELLACATKAHVGETYQEGHSQ